MHETLSQSCSTEEDESEFVINKQKDAKNETEYEEYTVTYDVLRYFNVFEWGRNIVNRLYVSYEQVCMATTKEKYYMKMLETLINYNDRNNGPFSNEKTWQAVRRVMEEMEGE